MWVRVKSSFAFGKGKKKNQASDFRQIEILKVRRKGRKIRFSLRKHSGQVLMTSQQSFLREVLQFELSRQTKLFYQQEKRWNILKIK